MTEWGEIFDVVIEPAPKARRWASKSVYETANGAMFFGDASHILRSKRLERDRGKVLSDIRASVVGGSTMSDQSVHDMVLRAKKNRAAGQGVSGDQAKALSIWDKSLETPEKQLQDIVGSMRAASPSAQKVPSAPPSAGGFDMQSYMNIIGQKESNNDYSARGQKLLLAQFAPCRHGRISIDDALYFLSGSGKGLIFIYRHSRSFRFRINQEFLRVNRRALHEGLPRSSKYRGALASYRLRAGFASLAGTPHA